MSGGNKGIRGNNDFTFEVRGAYRDFKRDGRVAHHDAMFDSDEFTESLLKFLDQRSIVCQPTPIERAVQKVQKARAISQIRPADMKRLLKSRPLRT